MIEKIQTIYTEGAHIAVIKKCLLSFPFFALNKCLLTKWMNYVKQKIHGAMEAADIFCIIY